MPSSSALFPAGSGSTLGGVAPRDPAESSETDHLFAAFRLSSLWAAWSPGFVVPRPLPARSRAHPQGSARKHSELLGPVACPCVCRCCWRPTGHEGVSVPFWFVLGLKLGGKDFYKSHREAQPLPARPQLRLMGGRTHSLNLDQPTAVPGASPHRLALAGSSPPLLLGSLERPLFRDMVWVPWGLIPSFTSLFAQNRSHTAHCARAGGQSSASGSRD